MTRLLLVFSALVLLSACGADQARGLRYKGVVQHQSPPPVPDLKQDFPDIDLIISDVENFDGSTEKLDQTYRTLRVRVFPILSVPPQDPYPETRNKNSVSLYNSRGLSVIDPTKKGGVIGTYKKIEMDVAGKKVLFDGQAKALKGYIIKPNDLSVTTTCKWDGGAVKVEYRGDFQIESTLHTLVDRATSEVTFSGNLWSVVNYVDIEDYLKAVVPSEMPSYFHEEALKAQAVAARTYAIFHAWLSRQVYSRTWDVDPTTWYQSYRGAQVENSKVTPAVEATAGKILAYQNKLIEAFFSANSGGKTCSVKECFQMKDRPYIVGKDELVDVKVVAGGTWTANLSAADVAARLDKLSREGKLDLKRVLPGYSGVGSIQGVKPYEVGTAGRVIRLAVVLKNGTEGILNFEQSREMRWQFRGKTAFYEIDPASQSKSQKIVGYGLGHGVGMSQWGANLMGKEGRLFDDILKFYYDGTSLVDLPAPILPF